MFDVQASAASSGPIRVIPVDGLPSTVSVESSEDRGGRVVVDVLVVFEVDGGCVARFSPSDEGSEDVTICNISTNETILSGVFGAIGGGGGVGSVSLAVGSTARPFFTHLSYVSSDGSLLSSLSASTPGAGASAVGGSSSAAGGAPAAAAPLVIGPHDVGGVKRPVVPASSSPAADEEDVTGMKKRAKNEDIGSEGGLVVGSDELTIEQRLEGLAASIAHAESQGSLSRSKKANAGGADSAPAAGPSADSLVTLIEQALQSGDDSLLEECLGCESFDVVDVTAQRLPTTRVVGFLRKLVAKFEKRPSRSALLTHWLASLLRHHTSYLISVPDLSAQLAGLCQILEQRLSSYSKLAALSGRLDLLMQQVSAGGSKKLVGAGKGEGAKPVQVYREE